MKRIALFSALLAACAPVDPSSNGDPNNQTTPTDPNSNSDKPLSADGGPEPIDLGEPPTITNVEARISGRYGMDLLIVVNGSDPDADSAALWVRILDDNGQPASQSSTSEDEDVDPNAGAEIVPFDEPIHGLPEFSTAYTRTSFFATPGAATQVEIAIQDAMGNLSPVKRVSFTEQPILGFGDPCDPTYRLNRCEPGMGCRGEPASCVEGVAPTVTRFAYLSDDGRPRILIEGDEPDDDMQKVHLEFLTEDDSPVAVDFDGDGASDADTFDAYPRELTPGGFFVELYPTDWFAVEVSRIAATPIDVYGNVGERVVTDLEEILERDWNQGCDPRGFDVCTAMATCIPGIPGESNKCGAPNRARQDQCEDSVTLYAPDDNLNFYGRANGASLWEPSEGCVTENGMNGPEEIVLLELSRGMPSVTLTTEFPNTDFDTVLYVMEGICPAPGADAIYLGCIDDTDLSQRAALTLTNVPAGDYLVIVDTWGQQGGNFRLSVAAE